MSETKQLRLLARLFGVQQSYYDVGGRLRQAIPEALLRVLGMLGAPVVKMSDVGGALRERQQYLFQQTMDPVIVVWDGDSAGLKLRVPSRWAKAELKGVITLESGETTECALRDDPSAKPFDRVIEGATYVTRRVKFSSLLPLGYHRLRLQIDSLATEHHLFVAPSRAFGENPTAKKSWGLFCPLYALSSAKSWGVGDFSDLNNLLDFVGELGGAAVGTLPLFAGFLAEPFNPSPYAPVSRLFWNETFLDIQAIEEFDHCLAARSMTRSTNFSAELKNLRAGSLVDYRRVMRLKREVLNELFRCLLKQPSERRVRFERFCATHSLAQDYAAFHAKTDGERRSWQQWEGHSRDGKLRAGDYLEHLKQYHLFVQWLADGQVRALGRKNKAGGPALYLDFPLGVNRDGYDVWRERDVFALNASGGAPPDDFFVKGQNWGFPPLHPEGLRRQGYRYYINCVRHHLAYAKMLRIDHVMGLHRFYWVPDGLAPTEGVYVRYPSEEFFAVLNLESHRYGAQIVGENLGTVSAAVNSALAKHNIRGMHVGQFGVRCDPNQALDPAPSHCVASLNTHDTPTFAGFWSGADIVDRRDLGLLTDEAAEREGEVRTQQRAALTAYLKTSGLLEDNSPDAAAVLRAWLAHLAANDTEFLLVNLEDLWLEALPQNVPGTWEERPNWQRKARYSLEQIRELPALRATLQMIDQLRKRGSESTT